MEIPEYLKVVLFALVSSFIVYAIEPHQVNLISAPISNFTNITRTVQYTVQDSDNVTKMVYFYGSITNMSKHIGMSKDEIIKQLMASRVFVINCTGIQEKQFGDPYNESVNCAFFGEHYVYR